MKKIREWKVEDKSDWGEGPWQNEPDKVQFLDEKTGLPVLIVRGPVGSWCGYVGVREGHPFFKIGYSSCSLPTAVRRGERFEDSQPIKIGDKVLPPWPKSMLTHLHEKLICDQDKEHGWCDHTPEHLCSVHGGLTFSGECVEATHEQYQKWRLMMIRTKREAEMYPKGDAAERWREAGQFIDDFEGWKEYHMAGSICHVPEPGEAKVWWLGFDCSHCDDISPKMDRTLRGIGSFGHQDDRRKYRDMEYVMKECADLAKQLSSLATPLPSGSAE